MIATARRIVGSGAIIFIIGVIAACTATSQPARSSTSSAASTKIQLVDPLDSVSDPNSADFVQNRSDPVLHVQGEGPSTYKISKPDGPAAIRFYVACFPASEFTIRMGTFFSGQCAGRFQNSGQFPTDATAAKMDVRLEIPNGVKYWILALPIQ